MLPFYSVSKPDDVIDHFMSVHSLEGIKGDYIASGASRIVYVYEKFPDYVLKIGRYDRCSDEGMSSCEKEYNAWQRCKNTPLALYLAPVIALRRIDGTTCSVQLRAEPVRNVEYAYLPRIFRRDNDLSIVNMGNISGQLVMIDYEFLRGEGIGQLQLCDVFRRW